MPAIAKPLQERKTFLNKLTQQGLQGNARKRFAGSTYLTVPTPKELNSFHQLQKAFALPTILHHFDEKKQLYVDLDANKEFGFGAHVYHSSEADSEKPSPLDSLKQKPQKPVSEKSSPKQKSQKPILFLSCLLTDAETRYWPTELEVAGLVWVVKKIRHMIEAAVKTTIIYIDHSAAVSIVRQTSLNITSIEKLNL